MHARTVVLSVAVAFAATSLHSGIAAADDLPRVRSPFAQLGVRPHYLVDQMEGDDRLKARLDRCLSRHQHWTHDFSIAHRGAPLQFPEHTRESYVAGSRQGAGILECDVTFTSAGELVCRHAECDLHTTTNILATDLASKCSEPFIPAELDAEGNVVQPASARCCTSDITLEEFKSLCGKMDAADSSATTVDDYLGGTADFRTDLYSTCATVLSHPESIELFSGLGAKFTPELKSGDPNRIDAVFGGQEAYAQAMIDDYKEAGINPAYIWAQSFNLDDVLYWVANEPQFGEQAVFLTDQTGQVDLSDPDDPGVAGDPENPTLADIAAMGVKIVAPPLPILVKAQNGEIVASKWSQAAKGAGLDIIAWTTERSGRIVEDVLEGGGNFYYLSTLDALSNDGDILRTIDVLAQQVGVLGIFSDWPATTTFYANCVGLK